MDESQLSQLKDYREKALASGMTQQDIEKALIGSGWSRDQINEAFASTVEDVAENSPKQTDELVQKENVQQKTQAEENASTQVMGEPEEMVSTGQAGPDNSMGTTEQTRPVEQVETNQQTQPVEQNPQTTQAEQIQNREQSGPVKSSAPTEQMENMKPAESSEGAEEPAKGKRSWILWTGIIVIFLLIIFALLWFFFLKGMNSDSNSKTAKSYAGTCTSPNFQKYIATRKQTSESGTVVCNDSQDGWALYGQTKGQQKYYCFDSKGANELMGGPIGKETQCPQAPGNNSSATSSATG
jgi:hypothetical protein